MYDAIIIGGGAAGMYCAITAARLGVKVAVVEKNDRLGKKLAITGKGRCNVTNNSDNETILKNIPRNARFLYSALSQCSAADVMAFFEELGVPLKTERGNRVFPVSDKAGDVVNALVSELKRLGVEIIRDNCTSLLIENGACVGIRTKKQELRGGCVVVATGGKSYPLTGSDGFGYKLAQQVGHTMIQPEPSLSAMVTEERWVSQLSGLDLRNISMKLLDNGKVIYEDFGELMFCDYGISGPTVLSASAHIEKMQPSRYSIRVDMKPALTEKQLDARILRDFAERKGKPFIEGIRGLMPAQMAPVFAELSGIDVNKRVDEVSKVERRRIVELLKGLELHISRFRPIEEAIITRGGVKVSEVSPKTMESKLCSGLYFIGEVLDCDAYTGGFNLQIAFSTAYSCATAIACR